MPGLPNVIPHPQTGRPIALPPITRLLLTKRQQIERQRLLRGRYFFVNLRQGNLGEVFRCSRCGGKHSRLTLYCLDQPFSGLLGGLWAYTWTVGVSGASETMAPLERARYAALIELFEPRANLGDVAQIADLADHHPQMARALAADAEPGRPGAMHLDVGMVSLGLLEQIDTKEAQRQLDRINTRAYAYGLPPLTVPGLAIRRGI